MENNRRQNIRSKIVTRMCALGFIEENEQRVYQDCFPLKTIDLSEGGARILHDGLLKPGDKIELRTKDKLSLRRCIDCKYAMQNRSALVLEPATAIVVWTNRPYAGIRFEHLSNKNKQIIGSIVWKKHIKDVRLQRASI
ncbi:MAG: PilZ domain-containing protein [Geovibrio sp.]|nr:PilZ domain-containing protein [Geovibrio sp.]MCD8569403.1 PilZ domain-containing protein [Geovibrio sp.]